MLRPDVLTVAPGRDASCRVSIRNTSEVVDQFVITIMGDAANWARAKPDVVNLLPNEEVVVEILFAPPRTSEVTAGEYPFAVRLVSREDPAGSVVREGAVTVEEFTELGAEVVPENSEGRRKGKHTLALDNTGNHVLPVDVTAADPDNRLHFRIRPHTPDTHHGTTTFVRVKARPRKYMWRGADRRHNFRITSTPQAGQAIVVEATYLQKPMLPRRLLLVLLCLLMVVMLLLLWLSRLLQDQPISAAGLAPKTTETSTPAAGGRVSVPKVTPKPTTTTKAPVRPAGGGGGGGGGNRVRTGDFSIRAVAYPGVTGPQLFVYVVPDGRTLRLNSVRFSPREKDEQGNPFPPDSGSLEVRQGDRVLTALDLADLDGSTHSFPDRPTVEAGDEVSLAISCANTSRTCASTATFAVTVER